MAGKHATATPQAAISATKTDNEENRQKYNAACFSVVVFMKTTPNIDQHARQTENAHHCLILSFLQVKKRLKNPLFMAAINYNVASALAPSVSINSVKIEIKMEEEWREGP